MNPNEGDTSTQPPLRITELDAVLEKDEASFRELFLAHFGQKEWYSSDPAFRNACAWYYPKVLRAFENKHGNLDDFSPCNNLYASVLLTEGNEIFIHYEPGQFPHAERILGQLYFLSQEAIEFVEGIALKRILQSIFDSSNVVLAIMDRSAKNSPGRDHVFEQDPTSYDSLLPDIDFIKRTVTTATQRQAQMAYFLGMSVGLAGLLTIVLVGAFVVGWADWGSGFAPNVASAVAGAVGAWVSVIQRMTSHTLKLDYRAGQEQIRVFGAVRPLVGAILGLAVYFLLRSEVLSLEIDVAEEREFLFACTVGFLAGFQERWAQDMLSLGTGRMEKTAAENTQQDNPEKI